MRTSFIRTARLVLVARRFRSAATSARRSRLPVVLGAALLSLALTAPASAAAIVIRDTITTPIFETDLPDDCRPGITGVLVGTDVVSYQSVETAQGFHIVFTVVDTGQIAWSDGTYTIIEATSHVVVRRHRWRARPSRRSRTRTPGTPTRPTARSCPGRRSISSSA